MAVIAPSQYILLLGGLIIICKTLIWENIHSPLRLMCHHLQNRSYSGVFEYIYWKWTQIIFFLDENILGTGNNLFLSTGSELFQHSWVSKTITIINGEKRTGQSVTVSAYLYKKICGWGVPPP